MSRINDAITYAQVTLVDFGAKAKRGTIWMADKTSRVLYDCYDLKNEGIEKLDKMVTANMDVITWIFELNKETLGIASKAIDQQRKLLYATKVLFDIDKIISDGGFRNIKGVLSAIADFLDACKFLQDNKVIAFAWFSRVSSKIGSFRVFVGIELGSGKVFGFSRRIEDIPLIGNILSKPKEIFIFFASALDLKDTYYDRNADGSWNNTLDNFLKVIGTVGKMVMLTLSDHTEIGKKHAFCLINFATQNASFVRYVMECSAKRERQFRPTRADVLGRNG